LSFNWSDSTAREFFYFLLIFILLQHACLEVALYIVGQMLELSLADIFLVLSAVFEHDKLGIVTNLELATKRFVFFTVNLGNLNVGVVVGVVFS
jgi:ubiquinone biosynthesis protein UbiJ